MSAADDIAKALEACREASSRGEYKQARELDKESRRKVMAAHTAFIDAIGLDDINEMELYEGGFEFTWRRGK